MIPLVTMCWFWFLSFIFWWCLLNIEACASSLPPLQALSSLACPFILQCVCSRGDWTCNRPRLYAMQYWWMLALLHFQFGMSAWCTHCVRPEDKTGSQWLVYHRTALLSSQVFWVLPTDRRVILYWRKANAGEMQWGWGWRPAFHWCHRLVLAVNRNIVDYFYLQNIPPSDVIDVWYVLLRNFWTIDGKCCLYALNRSY